MVNGKLVVYLKIQEAGIIAEQMRTSRRCQNLITLSLEGLVGKLRG